MNPNQGLSDVLQFWFPDNSFQEYWFSTEYDSRIKVEYFDLWTMIKNSSCEELVQMVDHAPNKHMMCLGIVIVLDQFTRNLLRTNDREAYGSTDRLCMEFLDRMDILTDLGRKPNTQSNPCITFESYPIHQRIFMLLPLRHQRTTPLLNFVMIKIKQMEVQIEGKDQKETKTERNIISRFKTATIKDYTKVTDTIVHTQNLTRTQSHLFPDSLMSSVPDPLMSSIPIPQPLIPNHIMDPMCVANYSMHPIRLSDQICQTSVYIETLRFLKNNRINDVCISLSGGVDSMVLCLILCQLREEGNIKNLVAVHVDYGNRDVSREECEFTANWCAYFGIPHITRRIEHMKRDGSTIVMDSVDRALYETETKNIRFNLYRHCMKLYGSENDESIESMVVMLGHHRDDLAENVLMNVLRGGDVLNLFTMKPFQVIDRVPVCRPMLGLPKSDIYQIAHQYEVPYLKDTTSEDCFRGTVRKNVFPALQKIDPMVLQKLNKIGKSSDRWNNVVKTQVIDPMIGSAVSFKHGFLIPFKESFLKLDEEVWKNVLCGIFHGKGIRMISNKNLINFIRWLPQRSGFNRLSNGYMVSFGSDSLIILRSGICHKIQRLPCIGGKDVPLKFDLIFKTMVFNGWTIRIHTPCPPDIPVFDNHLTPEDVLNGKFHLYYRTCKHCTREDAVKNSNRYCSVDDDTLDHGNITYSMGSKSSDNRRFFKGLGISRYIPNVHFGVQCKECKQGKDIGSMIVYRIDYSYE